MENEGRPLVTLALECVDRLVGDDAREEAIRTLGSVLAGIAMEPEAADAAFQTLLDLSSKLEAPWSRTRAFSDVCSSLACSRIPRERRGELLARALEKTRTAETVVERIDLARAVIEAIAEIQHDEGAREGLAALAVEAAALDDARARQRTLCQIAVALAKIGEGQRAIEILDQLAPSASRARALANVASELADAGEDEQAVGLLEATLGELRDEPESYEQALALRAVLTTLLEDDIELPGLVLDGAASGPKTRPVGSGTPIGIDATLDLVDRMVDTRFRKDALLGAIEALGATSLEGAELEATLARIRRSIDRIDETYTRGPLLGALAVALGERGDGRGAVRALEDAAALASHGEPSEVVDTLGDPSAALPVARVLAALASDEDAAPLHATAMRALEIVRGVNEPATVAAILRQCAQLFASPALPYDYRVALLDRALWVASAISAPDACVEAATAIANALSLAGATERGDGLFAGLVLGVDPSVARKAHLERAVTLVRLGRTAEARDQLVIGAESKGADAWHAVEDLARACAKCGFIGDVIGVLSHVDPSRQVEARAQVADVLAESGHIDPALRIIGLDSIGADADPAVLDVVTVLIAEVRLLEKMGDPETVLGAGFDRLAAAANPDSARQLEQQLVGAIIERLRRDNA